MAGSPSAAETGEGVCILLSTPRFHPVFVCFRANRMISWANRLALEPSPMSAYPHLSHNPNAVLT